MTQRDYEHGRKLILSRLKNAQRLLVQTRPEQTHSRQKLEARIGAERVELAKWEATYKAEQTGQRETEASDFLSSFPESIDSTEKERNLPHRTA